MSDDRGDIVRRKSDHIEVAASGAADFAERTTLLEHVALVHQALAEIAVEELDLSTELCGLRLYVEKRNTVAQRVYQGLGMKSDHYDLFEWLK